MTNFGTFIAIGAVSLVIGTGVAIYLTTKNLYDYDKFRDKCIKQAHEYKNENVVTIVIAIDKINDDVQPIFYRRHYDGRITRIEGKERKFPFDLLPEDIKAKFNKGLVILTKI